MDRLTVEQAVIISAYTGFLCSESFSDVHRYVEEKLKRPVFTHEFASDDFCERVREAVRPDFLEICFKRGEQDG